MWCLQKPPAAPCELLFSSLGILKSTARRHANALQSSLTFLLPLCLSGIETGEAHCLQPRAGMLWEKEQRAAQTYRPASWHRCRTTQLNLIMRTLPRRSASASAGSYTLLLLVSSWQSRVHREIWAVKRLWWNQTPHEDKCKCISRLMGWLTGLRLHFLRVKQDLYLSGFLAWLVQRRRGAPPVISLLPFDVSCDVTVTVC